MRAMRRRSRAGGEPDKTQRRKTAARKRGNAPKIARHQGSSAAGLQAEVAWLTCERDEALGASNMVAGLAGSVHRGQGATDYDHNHDQYGQ